MTVLASVIGLGTVAGGEYGCISYEWAIALFSEDAYAYDGLAIECSKSIAKLTGEKFTDFDSLGYTLDENGVPLIVIDARKWWLETGQFQDWSN